MRAVHKSIWEDVAWLDLNWHVDDDCTIMGMEGGTLEAESTRRTTRREGVRYDKSQAQ